MRKPVIITIFVLLLSLLLWASLPAKQRGIRIKARTPTGSTEVIKLYSGYHALVIGCGDYRNGWPRLPNAVNDAREIASVLGKKGWSVDLLENPDGEQLDESLNRLIIGPGRDRNMAILIWFSGHGHTLKEAGETSLGYIVPVDAPLPSSDELGFMREAINMRDVETVARRIRSKHVLMVFDSCFSGSMFNINRAAPSDYIQEKVAEPVRQIITAGDEKETVPDKSVFKTVFIQGIDKGYADRNRDGYVTGEELGAYAEEKVINYTRKSQHPQFGKIHDPKLDKGDFVFQLASSSGLTIEKTTPTLTKTLLKVTSNIGESKVFVDGVRKGSAPLTLKGLSPKRYRVKVTKEGYQPYEIGVLLRAGKSLTVRAILERLRGTLEVIGNPRGAKIFLDGYYAGVLPAGKIEVEPGLHTVSIEKEGYHKLDRSITVEAGGAIRLRLNLKPVETVTVESFQGTKSAKPIVLGVPTSLGFLEGKEGLACVNMAVDEINSAGGVKVGGVMRPFKVVAIDARGAEPGVPASHVIRAHKKLILEDKADFIVFGSFRSECAIACMDVVGQYKVPMILGTAMSPGMQKKVMTNYDKYKYTFRACLNAIYLIKYLGGTMGYLNKEFGFNKVFIMNQDVAWARKTGDFMIKLVFDKMGWEVVGRQQYPTGSSDFSAGLMKAKAKGAQVILPIFDMPQSGILVKQWKTMHIPALMAGFISPLAGPGAWKTFDGKIAGAMNCIFEIGNIPVPKVPKSVEFAEKYEKKYGKPIEAGHSPAPAYEMVYMLKEAIERAGSVNGDKVVAALEKTDRVGAMGRIKFGKDHQVLYGNDPAMEALGCMVQWREPGKRVIVYPPSVAEDKIELPEGLKSLK